MFDSALSERSGVNPREAAAKIRTGIICNPKSHRNRSSVEATKPFLSGTVLAVTPRTQDELAEVLTDFARHGIELLVIDGGDGTIRDVMTAAARVWTGAAPRVAIVPSGKTNALALDLGIPDTWTLDQALTAARHGRVKLRSPVEVIRKDSGAKLCGFLFGAGAFVDATALAQRTHRAGAFNGVAVGLALCWAILQTLFGGANSAWRAGNRMRIRFQSRGNEGAHAAGEHANTDRARYILLASTLKRMPIGIRPFGAPRVGLKTLVVDAPPRWLAVATPLIVTGSPAAWLDRAGYHRIDSPSFDLSIDSGFILDGEVYPGGDLTVREARAISFVVP
ncbi:diacylglycerol/lipid kinase family protein [Sphingomonas faeni]|uniref:diacylglycerol/lipid kinase family protein n=1 Tax=Sphingomonas faeni TaxID=185950 RepID=UPI003350DCB0